MNAKKINMGMITWVFFERVRPSVCACTVCTHECARLESWGSVLWLEHGHCDYYRGAVFSVPAESNVNPHFSFPCPNTRLHSLLCKRMRKDICLEFLAFNER